VMNLVALLIAPLVVSFADDGVTRVLVAVGTLVVVAGAIWYSKHLKSAELVPETDPPSPEAAAVTTKAS
jgi:hypothetical protein